MQFLRTAFFGLIHCCLYLLLGKAAGFLLGSELTWAVPASGIGIGFLIFTKYRYWPSVALGSFLSSILTNDKFLSSVSITIASTLEALVGAYIYFRFKQIKNALSDNGDLRFLGVIFSSIVAPLAGVLISSLFLPAGFFVSLWVYNTVGTLAVLSCFTALNKNKDNNGFNWKTALSFVLYTLVSFLVLRLIFDSQYNKSFLFTVHFLIFGAIYFFKKLYGYVYLTVLSLAILVLSQYYQPLFSGSSFHLCMIYSLLFSGVLWITYLVVSELYLLKSHHVPALVLMGGLFLCGVLFFSLRVDDLENEKRKHQAKIEEMQNSIKERMNVYEDALIGGRSFFTASDAVNEKSWKKYVDTLNISEKYPGINGVGVIYEVPAKNREAYLSKIRQEIPDFNIKKVPAVISPEQKNSFVITYIIPFEGNQQARGLDVGSEQKRRKAIELARDTGQPAITSAITLVQDSKKGAGFLLYVPFYKGGKIPTTVEERRKTFQGAIYAPFVSENFFNGIIDDRPENEKLSIRIFHGDTAVDSNLAFLNNKTAFKTTSTDLFETTTRLKLAQNNFILEWKQDEAFFRRHGDNHTIWAAVIGSMVSLLFSILIFSFENTGKKAQLIADKQTFQFLEEKEKAVAAAKVKAEFLANVSHEIRTPLNGIIGMINLLNKSNLNSEDRAKVEIVAESCTILTELIDDLLKFSKLEANRVELNNEPLHLKELAHNVVVLFSSRAEEKGLDINYTYNGDQDELIFGDELRLKQVFCNLIGNAVKFTEKGCVKIFISVRGIDVKKREVTVKISDTGIGIKKEALGQLFKSFSQVDASSKKKFGGTGLGLSVCKGIVELMGGKIWVETEYGIGSTFIFEFLTETAPASKKIADIGNSEYHGDKILQEPISIMVVDDNRVNQKVASMSLEMLGYSCDVANGGAQAIQLASSKNYDLIFMDCYMPEMDGFTATMEIRKICKNKLPHIVALTASITDEDYEKCMSSGMDAFLAKPIKIENLNTEIGVAMDKKQKKLNQQILEKEDLAFNNYLQENFMNNYSLYQGVAHSFLNQYENLMVALRKAVDSRNSKDIQFHAHDLKSSVSIFQHESTMKYLAQMHANARNGDLSSINENLSAVEQSLSELVQQIHGNLRLTSYKAA